MDFCEDAKAQAEYLQIKNWNKYQQCDRNAPWIKLHTEILQDYKILNLSDSDKLAFFMILLYAGRAGNKIPNDRNFLSSIFCMDDLFDMDKLIAIGLLEEWSEGAHNQYIETKAKNIEKRKEIDRQNKRKKRMSDSDARKSDSENKMSELPETETETETQHRGVVKSDFQKVYEAAIDLFPDLIAKNTAIIHQWINGGCKPSLIIEQMTLHKGKKIKSFEYFKDIIPNAKATAEAKMPAGVVTSYRNNETPKANVIKLGGKNATIS